MTKRNHTDCPSAHNGRHFKKSVRKHERLEQEGADRSEIVAEEIRIEGLAMASLACEISSPIGAVSAIAQIYGTVYDIQSQADEHYTDKYCDAAMAHLKRVYVWITDHFELDGKEVGADFFIP